MGRGLPPFQGFLSVLRFLSFLWAFLFLVPLNNVSAQSGMDQTGILRTGTWSLSVMTRNYGGAFCLFENPQGSVRIEANVTATPLQESGISPQALDNLLWRQFGGWTVILAENGTGIINPWDESWEVIDPDLMVYLRSMLGALDYSKMDANHQWPSELKSLEITGVPMDRPLFEDSPTRKTESIRFELPVVGTDLSFRQKMVFGGTGRGLNGEILNFTIESIINRDTLACDSVVLRSSRRPGAFRMTEQKSLRVFYADNDPFLAMWPLGDLLRFK